LSNKVTNTNIGGVEFVHKEALETFKLAASDTMYKYIESNVYGERKQELPEVKEVTIANVLNQKFESEKVNDDLAYNVTLNIVYQKDLGYPKEVNLTLVHLENKLYVVQVK
jgi:hypothetical protein